MNRALYRIKETFLAPIALVLAILLLVTITTVAGADEGISYGMTKVEVYEEKGIPDQTVRIPEEEGKEMWVYKCESEDGINEDCLFLFFDGDKLVKIERP